MPRSDRLFRMLQHLRSLRPPGNRCALGRGRGRAATRELSLHRRPACSRAMAAPPFNSTISALVRWGCGLTRAINLRQPTAPR